VGAEETVVQIRKLKRLAAERGYRLVPGHDPVAWSALTGELTTRWPASR
jgi:N-acyl homoserine lactone hydrolase